jgi:hypothetical protein
MRNPRQGLPQNWIAFLALVAACNADAAKLVVMTTDDPLLVPGMVIDSEKVTLTAGKTLTVITATGQKAVLKGPHDGPWTVPGAAPGAGDALRTAALSSLLATGATRTSSVGVVRNVGGKSKQATFAPDLRQISVAANGVQCVNESASYSLWRPADLSVAKVSLADAAGKETTFDWGGSETAALPAGVVADQATLVIRTDDQAPIKVTLRVVPGAIADPIERVVWMSNNQCTTQARLLLDQMLRD